MTKKTYSILTSRGQRLEVVAPSPKIAWRKVQRTHFKLLEMVGIRIRPIYNIHLADGTCPINGWKKVKGVE